MATLPGQIVAGRRWLEELAGPVPARLGGKKTLVTWPLRDMAFPAKGPCPGVCAAFEDVRVVELPHAKHFFQEDGRPRGGGCDQPMVVPGQEGRNMSALEIAVSRLRSSTRTRPGGRTTSGDPDGWVLQRSGWDWVYG